EKDADGNITIPAGQIVYKEYYEGNVYDFCMVPVTYAFEKDGDGEEVLQYYYHDSMKLNLVDGKYVADNPDMIMGLCEYYDENQSYYWTGYGDGELNLSPVKDTPMEMPSNLAAEKWAALTDDGGYFVQVALDGSKVYVGGMIYSNPDACMTGEISPDGKTVTFSSGQFLGASLDWTWSYVYGGDLEEIWDEEWEEYVYIVHPTGDLVFDYDAEARRMVSKNALAICANASDDIDEVEAVSYLPSLTLELQHRNPDAVPADPDQVSFLEEFEAYGANTLYFNIPEVDVDGNLLEPSMLYYRMYVDGDVFTFYDDEYLGVDEDGQELLSANFSNFESIYSSGTYKCIYLFFQGADEVGVQSVYMQPTDGGEPKELCSKIVTVSTAGLRDAVAGKSVKSSVYYDLQGRQVLNPTSGFYVRRDVMTDGSTAVAKVMLR
ncbi:MAG: hypothetical protein K2F74_06550, partial [Muribaculaceae bacterium]|nr:hypothetical protein [Muribaculaceae bacterium]